MSPYIYKTFVYIETEPRKPSTNMFLCMHSQYIQAIFQGIREDTPEESYGVSLIIHGLKNFAELDLIPCYIESWYIGCP